MIYTYTCISESKEYIEEQYCKVKCFFLGLIFQTLLLLLSSLNTSILIPYESCIVLLSLNAKSFQNFNRTNLEHQVITVDSQKIV